MSILDNGGQSLGQPPGQFLGLKALMPAEIGKDFPLCLPKGCFAAEIFVGPIGFPKRLKEHRYIFLRLGAVYGMAL